MKITGKPIRLGVPLFMVAAMVAVLAIWAWGPIGGAGGGPSDTAGLKGQITWTVYDASGNIKAHDVIQNDINTTPGLDSTVNRLVLVGKNPAATDIYDGIVAIAVPAGVTDSVDSSDDPTNGFLSGNLTKLLDGDSAVTTSTSHENPADGTNPLVADAGTGITEVQVKFFSRADGVIIRQLGLVRTTETSTHTAPATITDDELLAHQPVNITLDTADTLEVTWRLTVTAQ